MSQEPLDLETQLSLTQLSLQDSVKSRRVAGVRTILVQLSAAGMVYDIHSLRHEIALAYPDAAIFFRASMGKAVGAECPKSVDLLIDLTGPGQRQGLFYARKLRRMARVAVGRNAGLFRKKIFDRVFDEKAQESALPTEKLVRERKVQKEVLSLAGVALALTGETHPDRGKTIALELPPMRR